MSIYYIQYIIYILHIILYVLYNKIACNNYIYFKIFIYNLVSIILRSPNFYQ